MRVAEYPPRKLARYCRKKRRQALSEGDYSDKRFFEKNDIKLLEWPPYSLDLSSIEKILE